MAGTAKKAAAEKPKATRTVLTPEERIEKAERELAALRQAVVDKAKAKRAGVVDQLTKAQAALEKAKTKVADLERELEGIDATVGAGEAEAESPELKVV